MQLPGTSLGNRAPYVDWLIKKSRLHEEIADVDRTVRAWEEEHGTTDEGQEYLALADFKDQAYKAFTERLCEGLQKGMACALCLYGMERCANPAATTAQVRAMDVAFQNSPVFEEKGREAATYGFLFRS